MTLRNIGKALVAAALVLLVAGCATVSAPDERDPWEPVNRVTFEVNDVLDRAVIKPVAEGYRFVLPSEVRSGVRNFFANLHDPWIAANQFLQGKVDDGLSDLWRFIANSTFGLGGIFDIASDMRMPKHNEDFGQTLAVWGLGFGPYFVLPVLGPSSVRDAGGRGVDFLAYLPAYIPEWVDLRHRATWVNGLSITEFVQARADLLDTTTALDQAALDRYAFVRNAYFQRRRNLIYDGNPPMEPRPPEPEEEEEAPPPGPASYLVEPKVPANYGAVLEASASHGVFGR